MESNHTTPILEMLTANRIKTRASLNCNKSFLLLAVIYVFGSGYFGRKWLQCDVLVLLQWALQCTVMHNTTVLQCPVLHYSILHCTVLYCTALHCTGV